MQNTTPWGIPAAGMLLFAACGDVSNDPLPTVEAPTAVPPGRSFMESLEVRLVAPTESRIFYTMDGSSPVDEEALVYDGPLQLFEQTLIQFVAQGPDGRWSLPSSELYRFEPAPRPVRPIERGLALSKDAVFFTAEVDDVQLEKTIELRSVGILPVYIRRSWIGSVGGYFEEGVFEADPLPEGYSLQPGERLQITIRYAVRSTLRTAALVFETDDLRAEEGVWVVSLGGRVAAF